MAMLLHVQASPRDERSYSVRVARAFLETYQAAHVQDTIRTLDLSTAPIPEFDSLASAGKYRLLHGEKHTPAEAAAWRSIEAAIADFLAADKLLVSSPMWNFGIPYRLKQYIDVIVQPGYTFTYTAEQGYRGLVTGRPCLLILARGGAYPAGTEAAGLDFQLPYLKAILGFIGFTDIRTIVVEPTLAEGPQVAEQKLTAAIAQARRQAERF